MTISLHYLRQVRHLQYYTTSADPRLSLNQQLFCRAFVHERLIVFTTGIEKSRGRERCIFGIQGCRAARGMNNCPAERLFLFCQAVRNGIMNQFAGSFHADLFQDASAVRSHRVYTQMDLFRDLIQCLSSSDHTEHLKLPIGEPFRRANGVTHWLFLSVLLNKVSENRSP